MKLLLVFSGYLAPLVKKKIEKKENEREVKELKMKESL